MSISLTSPESHECERDGCDEQRTEFSSVDGSFCSERCASLAAGRKLLAHLEQDHRFCNSCYRRRKEIERPPAHTPEFVVGYEYLTRHAEHGERESRAHVRVDADDDPVTGQKPKPADRLILTSAICRCGTTDHRDAWLREHAITSIRVAAEQLLERLTQLREEGQHDKTIDRATLVATLRETYAADGELDWELAVGNALRNA